MKISELRVLVCDDSPLIRKKLAEILGKVGVSSVIQAEDGEQAVELYRENMPDLVFMDIVMNEINGIETAKQLRQADTKILIVFTTTSSEYAFDAFPIHPFDYILKPYDGENVYSVLSEAVRVLQIEELIIKVKVSRSEYEIPARNISSVVSQGHNTEINLVNGECLLSNTKFGELENLLLGHRDFLVCNRGIIVNMSQILTQEQGIFVMKNGARYPIRVNGQSKVTAAFFQYLISNMRAGK